MFPIFYSEIFNFDVEFFTFTTPIKYLRFSATFVGGGQKSLSGDIASDEIIFEELTQRLGRHEFRFEGK